MLHVTSAAQPMPILVHQHSQPKYNCYQQERQQDASMIGQLLGSSS
ncbi:hypothetical protein [Hymenobacter setariae]|nr:hypothetical protein [Hymenobacter setariae]